MKVLSNFKNVSVSPMYTDMSDFNEQEMDKIRLKVHKALVRYYQGDKDVYQGFYGQAAAIICHIHTIRNFGCESIVSYSENDLLKEARINHGNFPTISVTTLENLEESEIVYSAETMETGPS